MQKGLRRASYIARRMSRDNGTQLQDLILAECTSGGVGVLMSTVIFILLLCGKAYKTVLQRLFIYTILAIMVHDLTQVANAVYNYYPNSKAQVCKYIGFISIWSSWSVYIFYMVIIIYLLIFVYIQIKGDVCTLIVKRTKYFKVSVEFVTVLGSILLPTLVLWIPFVFTNYNYEFHNGFCWITGTNTSQLESNIYFGGFILYEGVGLVALCVILGIMIVYWTLSAIFQRAKDLLRHIIILLVAIIVTWYF